MEGGVDHLSVVFGHRHVLGVAEVHGVAGEVSVAEVGVEEQQRLVGRDVHGDFRHEVACGQGT